MNMTPTGNAILHQNINEAAKRIHEEADRLLCTGAVSEDMPVNVLLRVAIENVAQNYRVTTVADKRHYNNLSKF